ncbi:RNI-like protein [Wolfiporia cocos MD-104 SS10]|uniref:RNI-like protein n=1 Tax=Wolfiporia cocos (strain MD-104) TaxID=742152 RepID=A0A2H3JSB7_WOLCO|nr:RNI-like protein [Wolfiporia cocos MD-104 SS10]
MWKSDMPKPPAGDIVDCAKCKKQFTVTKYTLAANPPPGWLCHPCSKASGVDPFKKPAAPRKRKTPGEKRVVVNFEERRLPSLVSMCIQLISEHIDDVEALGDIGRINMDEIAKAISKNRSLTPQNAPLFYDVTNTDLTLYDVTNLTPPSLCALASLNPNLVNLRLDLCGRINDSVIDEWCTSLPNLTRIELLGPFLVKAPAWQAFFKAHRGLEGFLITQSPRFDIECARALVENCPNLSELRLKEIGQFSDDFLPLLKPLAKCLTSLELSYPGDREALSEAALIELLRAMGAGLTHLDLSGNINIGDGFLFKGIKPHTRKLSSLTLADTPALTDAGVAEFFDTWAAASGHAPNPPLVVINMSRNHLLKGDALITLLKHSGEALTLLNINGWREASEDALRAIAEYAPQMRKLDIGFCREVNDYTIKALLEGCVQLEEAKVWGCQRVTITCPRKRGVSIEGIEAQSLA